MDIAFVVDNSGSIRDSNVAGQPDNFNQVLEFMKTIVNNVQVSAGGNHIASVSFGKFNSIFVKQAYYDCHYDSQA